MHNTFKINIKKLITLRFFDPRIRTVYHNATMSIFENDTSASLGAIAPCRRIIVGVVCTTKYYTISGFGFLRATQIGPLPRTRTRPA